MIALTPSMSILLYSVVRPLHRTTPSTLEARHAAD